MVNSSLQSTMDDNSSSDDESYTLIENEMPAAAHHCLIIEAIVPEVAPPSDEYGETDSSVNKTDVDTEMNETIIQSIQSLVVEDRSDEQSDKKMRDLELQLQLNSAIDNVNKEKIRAQDREIEDLIRGKLRLQEEINWKNNEFKNLVNLFAAKTSECDNLEMGLRKNIDLQKDEIQRLTHQVKIAKINKENAEKNEEMKRIEKINSDLIGHLNEIEKSFQHYLNWFIKFAVLQIFSLAALMFYIESLPKGSAAREIWDFCTFCLMLQPLIYCLMKCAEMSNQDELKGKRKAILPEETNDSDKNNSDENPLEADTIDENENETDNDRRPRIVQLTRGSNGKYGFSHREDLITVVSESAEAQGVKRGDEIISINGIAIYPFSREEIIKILAYSTETVELDLRFNPDRLKSIERP